MLSVKGRFTNGVAAPIEPVQGFEERDVIITFLTEDDEERSMFADLRAASRSALQQYWDNEEDAVYDNL